MHNRRLAPGTSHFPGWSEVCISNEHDDQCTTSDESVGVNRARRSCPHGRQQDAPRRPRDRPRITAPDPLGARNQKLLAHRSRPPPPNSSRLTPSHRANKALLVVLNRTSITKLVFDDQTVTSQCFNSCYSAENRPTQLTNPTYATPQKRTSHDCSGFPWERSHN